MDLKQLTQVDSYTWRIEASGKMRVPVVLYGDKDLVQEMDDKVPQQAMNVATLPGIVGARLCHAGCPLGLWFPDWRRSRV